MQEIRAALLQWKVVFFRDQHLNHRQQTGFARQLGELTPGHVVFGNDADYPAIYAIAKHRMANRHQREGVMKPWTALAHRHHRRHQPAGRPPFCAARSSRPTAATHNGTNLVVAYDSLSPTLQGFIDGLRGVHRYAVPQTDRNTEEYDAVVRRRTMVSEHPLVRVHPETGERALYCSPSFLKSIVGLTPRESEQVLELLWEHAIRPEFTVRFRWEPGSVAFWDNRSTAHLAPRDIFATDFDRQFYRITLMGDVPVGVDGKESISVEGDPITPL